MSDWQPADTAPYNQEFLGMLSNGWVIKFYPTEDPDDWPYQWWRTTNTSVPILHTHRDQDWSDTYSLLLVGWMPCPEPDEKMIDEFREALGKKKIYD